MREDATGAESPAGKIDGGAATDTKVKAEDAPLFDAPAGPADDLKLISGVGPVLERNTQCARHHHLGAGCRTHARADRQRRRRALRFPGRVARDQWIEQAEALAKGGVEEYARCFGKDPR